MSFVAQGLVPCRGDGRGTRPRATVNIATSNKVEQCSSIIMLNAVVEMPLVENLDLCIMHTQAGERISPTLAALLDPINPATLHEYVLRTGRDVELHCHDYDEYWWFTGGSPIVTLWTKATGAREYKLQPGDLVACVRGVAHTLRADHDLVYHQFSSVRRPGAREGHLPIEKLIVSYTAATKNESQ